MASEVLCSGPGNNRLGRYLLSENTESATLTRVVFMYYVNVNLDLIYMLSTVSNAPPASAFKTSSDLITSSWNLLMEPDILVPPCQDHAVMDSRKTKGTAITDFRVDSISRSEAVLASAENSKASNNVGRQAALTAICSSDHLDAEHSKYDTGDKISRPTRRSRSKRPEAINSVALPYEDQMYNAGFNVKGDLARHTKTHDPKRSFKCDACDREFANASNLKRHTRTHTSHANKRHFQCDLCAKNFTQKHNLMVHKRSHTGELPFQCDVCKKKFTQKRGLTVHKRIHTGERPFQCNVCKHTFSRADHLRVHKRTHTNERHFQCDLCAQKFTQKHSLMVHKRSHTGELPFQCDVCKKKFTQKYGLTVHKRIHTGERPFQCDVCKHTFKRANHLLIHKRTHTNKRPFQCDVCKQKFTQRYGLIVHKRIHTGERPFRCDVCQHTSRRADHLLIHKRTHASKHPFHCAICNKDFTQKTHLRVHMDSHIDTRRFKCDICGAGFPRKSALGYHMHTHDENRQFKCDTCGKAFKTDKTLWSHKFTHSNEYLFECDTCNAKFKIKSTLTRHKKIHTDKQPNKANRKSSKISSKRFTNDRNPDQLEPDHNNKKSFKSSHCDASFTSAISTQHIKPKTHTTHSETGSTNPDNVSTTNQLPSMSNQPSTSDTHVNKSQNQEEYAEYVKTVALLNEFADAYPVTLNPGSCEHDDNLSFDQEIPEETFSDRQNTDAGYLITQWHPVAGRPSTNGIHINKSQNQKKYEEYAEYVKTVELLNEFADTYPITLNPGSCGHHDNLFLDQEMP